MYWQMLDDLQKILDLPPWGVERKMREKTSCVRASGAGDEDDLRTLTQKTLVIGHRATLKKEDAATLG